MDIEIFPPEHSDSWDFLLDDFLHTIQLARDRLILMKKVDE